MTYLAYARKYRPQTFSEVRGQQHVLAPLVGAIRRGKVHHALLLTGTHGSGKTSVARIMAKALNCPHGESAQPCLQCDVCVSIKDGQSLDVLEIDAASRTKVEDTRELLEFVNTPNLKNRYKVIIIDEVHMLSKSSFNALLKTLEEPPAYTVFILATTEIQKLPSTILSRCLVFHFRPLSESVIQEQLAEILQQEGVNFESEAIDTIAHVAAGSMRDGLSLLDQATAMMDKKLTAQVVQSMLGRASKKALCQLLADIIHGRSEAVLQWVDEHSERGIDFAVTAKALCALLHELHLLLAVPQTISASSQWMQMLCTQVDLQQAQMHYQIMLHAQEDLALAPSPRMGFEMLCLRMLSFKPVPDKLQEHVMLSTEAVVASEEAQDLQAVLAAEEPKVDQEKQGLPVLSTLPLSGLLREFARHLQVVGETEQCLSAILAPEYQGLMTAESVSRLQQVMQETWSTKQTLDIKVQTAAAPVQADSQLQQLIEGLNATCSEVADEDAS